MKKYFGTVADREGNAVAGAEVEVHIGGTGGTLATTYSDNGVTPVTNPLTTDNDGYFEAYFADGVHSVVIKIEGETVREVTGIQHFDEEDNEIKALRSVTSAADKGFYFTGSGTGAVFDLTSGGRALGGLSSAADKMPYFTGSGTASTADLTAAGRALIDDASASAQRTTLGLGTISTFDEATAAQYRADTSGKALSTDKVWSAADYVALTPGTNVAVDMSTGFNFSLAMGDNYTLSNPTNTKNGQTGAIVITQDGTGSRTLAYAANWKFAGGSDPVLSTAPGSVDVLFYQVISSSSIFGTLIKAIA